MRAFTSLTPVRTVALAAAVSLQLVAGVLVATPAGAAGPVPAPPTLVEGFQTAARTVEVVWDAPAAVPGSSALISYTATTSPTGLTCTTTNTTAGNEFCSIENLTPGENYVFTVVATNADGSSPPSEGSAPVEMRPFVVPGAPVISYVRDDVTSAEVVWAAPVNAGPPVLAYRATISPGGQTCVTGNLSCSIISPPGAAYSVVVVALNEAGGSAPSAPWVPLRWAVPDAPWDVRVSSVGMTSATVRWSGVASYFGNSNGYTVTSDPGGFTCATAATSDPALQPNACVVQGLTPGTSYRFVANAYNSNGTGPQSTPSAAVTTLSTPVPVFGSPRPVPSVRFPRPPQADTTPPPPVVALAAVGILATDGSAGVRLAWDAVGDVARVRLGIARGIGNPMPDYGTAGTALTLTRTTAVVTGLRPGVTYSFSVYAADAAGNLGPVRTVRIEGTAARSSGPAAVPSGGIARVRLTLRDLAGLGLANKPVDILVRTAGNAPWRAYRRVRTNATGDVFVAPRLTGATQFALRFAGEVNRAALPEGGLLTVRVRPSVTAALTVGTAVGARVAGVGARATLTGVVAPGRRGEAVYLQRLVGKAWKNVAKTVLGPTRNYGFVLSTRAKGTASYRILRPEENAIPSGVSAVHILTVT